MAVPVDHIWVWMEGNVVPARDGRVPVLDHGFLYGDSVYETLRTYDGRLFAVEDHLTRLEESAAAIGLALPWDRAALGAALVEAADARPAGSEAGLRLMVTRGVGPLGLDPAPCTAPGLIVFAWPVPPGRHPAFEEGVSVVITRVRRNPVGALDPAVKSGNFLNNIQAFREAAARGAHEGILLTLQGEVAEGTTSNVFWVRGGEVYTPAAEGILHGVTRKHLLNLLEGAGISTHEGHYPAGDLTGADEVFITSTLRGVLPVGELDGAPVGDGGVGATTRRLADLYEARVRDA